MTGDTLGFCLFLSLVLARTISILGDLVTAEEQLVVLKAKVRVSTHRSTFFQTFYIRLLLNQKTKYKWMRSRREWLSWRRSIATLVRMEAFRTSWWNSVVLQKP